MPATRAPPGALDSALDFAHQDHDLLLVRAGVVLPHRLTGTMPVETGGVSHASSDSGPR